MNIQDIKWLACEFPRAIYYEDRDIESELANAFEMKDGYESGTASELEKKYKISNLKFIIIMCSDTLISFNYDSAGKYLLFVAKNDEVFNYQNHRGEAWIADEQFNSFEGLNMVQVAQNFRKGDMDDSLKKVTEG